MTRPGHEPATSHMASESATTAPGQPAGKFDGKCLVYNPPEIKNHRNMHTLLKKKLVVWRLTMLLASIFLFCKRILNVYLPVPLFQLFNGPLNDRDHIRTGSSVFILTI